jgi:DNA repair ATPase RecN
MRQQYLIPARLVRKVRALSKRQKVPATEIVRRALDAYTEAKPGAASEDELVDRLLTEAFEMIEQVTATLGDLNRKIDTVQRRIDSGEIRRQAETEMHRWLEANPGAVAEFRKHIAAES